MSLNCFLTFGSYKFSCNKKSITHFMFLPVYLWDSFQKNGESNNKENVFLSGYY